MKDIDKKNGKMKKALKLYFLPIEWINQALGYFNFYIKNYL